MKVTVTIEAEGTKDIENLTSILGRLAEGDSCDIQEDTRDLDDFEPELPFLAPAPSPLPIHPAGAPTLDAEGLPWDERIHASSKAFLADGTWRQKRGVDRVLLASVRAEQMGAKANTAPPAAGDPYVPPPPPPPPPLPLADSPASGWTIAAFMPLVTAGMTAGQFNEGHIAAACASVEVPGLAALGAQPELISAVGKALDIVGF